MAATTLATNLKIESNVVGGQSSASEKNNSWGSSDQKTAIYYHSHSKVQNNAGEWLITMMGGINFGTTVLVVGCGTGIDAFKIAELVGPNGKVIAFDLNPIRVQTCVEQLNQKPHLVHTLEFLIGDAQDLAKYGDNSIDILFANSIIHFLPNQNKAYQEFARVTRPDGMIAISSGDGNHPPAIITLRNEIFAANGLQTSDFLTFPRREDLVAQLTRAGICVSQTRLTYATYQYQTFEEGIKWVDSSTEGRFVSHLGAEKDKILEELRRDAAGLCSSDGTFVYQLAYHLVIGIPFKGRSRN